MLTGPWPPEESSCFWWDADQSLTTGTCSHMEDHWALSGSACCPEAPPLHQPTLTSLEGLIMAFRTMRLQEMSSERLLWKNEIATQERNYTHFFLKKGHPFSLYCRR